ncbi:ash family protein [Rouxiella sp. Mn2063]|uniref:ash family protein n=1 Tax=Rouxiella sp. Mn2063 TaxID=3395262 RepID=UPI003BF54E5F
MRDCTPESQRTPSPKLKTVCIWSIAIECAIVAPLRQNPQPGFAPRNLQGGTLRLILRLGATVFEHLLQMDLYLQASMVAQMGQPSGWPVAFRAGTANLTWAVSQLQ